MHAMAEVAATPVIPATYHEREARALAERCGEGRANSVDDLAVQGVAAGRRVLAKCGPNLPTFRDLWESVLQMDIVRVGPRCRRAFRSRAAI
jgi:hypothetical protein